MFQLIAAKAKNILLLKALEGNISSSSAKREKERWKKAKYWL
jgi:hypothetical protein